MPVALSGIGFPENVWARFKGEVDAEALEGALKQVAPEYRDLVRRYFVELAREGGRQEAR
jgi:hypothetical protein